MTSRVTADYDERGNGWHQDRRLRTDGSAPFQTGTHTEICGPSEAPDVAWPITGRCCGRIDELLELLIADHCQRCRHRRVGGRAARLLRDLRPWCLQSTAARRQALERTSVSP